MTFHNSLHTYLWSHIHISWFIWVKIISLSPDINFHIWLSFLSFLNGLDLIFVKQHHLLLHSLKFKYLSTIFIGLMCCYLVIHFWLALTYHLGYLVFVTRVVVVTYFRRLRMGREVSNPLSSVSFVSFVDFGTRFWPVSRSVVTHQQFLYAELESGTC